MSERCKWLAALAILMINFLVVSNEYLFAKQKEIVINSIVQRADGIFFDIIVDGKNRQIVSASAAKVVLEKTCPLVHFAPGVLQ